MDFTETPQADDPGYTLREWEGLCRSQKVGIKGIREINSSGFYRSGNRRSGNRHGPGCATLTVMMGGESSTLYMHSLWN